jgi:hypothetical protein
MDQNLHLVNKIKFGNEIEAIHAINLLKSHKHDKNIYDELCWGYALSDIDEVKKLCGKLIGPLGKLKAKTYSFSEIFN